MNHAFRVSIATLACALLPVTAAFAAPTVIEHVTGYTLAGDRLQRFDALAFEHGKVLATGHAAALRKTYRDAKVIDGHGKTLLPGLIDAHGHVLDLGLASVRIRLEGTSDLKDALERVRLHVQSIY